MNKQAHAPGSSFRLSPWWALVPLVPLLAGGCNKSRDLDCGESKRFFLISDPKQGAGAAPLSIEQSGREVELKMLEKYPDDLMLKADTNRGNVDWTVLGHIYRYTEFIYSPAEGLLRNANHPEDVVQMKVFYGERPVRVRFGFATRACVDLQPGDEFCQLGKEKLYFIADMTCKHRRVELLDE